MSRAVTVIVREVSSPMPPCYDKPLVFWLDLPQDHTEEDIQVEVARERMRELEFPLALLGEAAEGIVVDLVYPGHIAPIEDYR